MPAPSVCEITFPPDGWTAGAAPDGTATMDVTVQTDPTTKVEIFFGAVSHGDRISNGSGLATFTAVEFPTGTTELKAVAGLEAPDITTSETHEIVVENLIDGIDDPTEWSVARYLNWLAGNTVINTANLATTKDAACAWAGVSPIDYSYLGALNMKAGITDRSLWVSVNTALNFLAYSTLDLDECVPWLTDQAALLKICQEA